MTVGRDRISAGQNNTSSNNAKINTNIKEKWEKGDKLQNTIGALPFHKDRAGSVIPLKARHHRIYTAWATY